MANYYDSYYRAGNLADRPAPGVAGRVFSRIDGPLIIERDTGAAWSEVFNSDSRYYTKDESLAEFSPLAHSHPHNHDGSYALVDHTHDHSHGDLYYTEAETDALLAQKASLSGADFTGAVTNTLGFSTNASYVMTEAGVGRARFRYNPSFSRFILDTLAADGVSYVVRMSMMGMQDATEVGIGNNPAAGYTLRVAGATRLDDTLLLREIAATPSDPINGTEANLYVKGDKLIVQFNNAGTVRYKYLDLQGTGVTWVHTTVAP